MSSANITTPVGNPEGYVAQMLQVNYQTEAGKKVVERYMRAYCLKLEMYDSTRDLAEQYVEVWDFVQRMSRSNSSKQYYQHPPDLGVQPMKIAIPVRSAPSSSSSRASAPIIKGSFLYSSSESDTDSDVQVIEKPTAGKVGLRKGVQVHERRADPVTQVQYSLEELSLLVEKHRLGRQRGTSTAK